MKSSLILIDKAPGITSFSVVARVKKIFGINKAGHCGTLDPDATGLLPVMLSGGVKASEYLTDHDKSYIAAIRLGVVTDTGDIGGKILRRFDGALPSFDEFSKAALEFKGVISQTPPMYSALKVNGQKLVDLARKGIEIERQPREIEIYSIKPFESDSEFYIQVDCSRGTYIRTLCEDIGTLLGCGATMLSLRRTRVGSFDISDAVTLEQLEQMSPGEREAKCITIENIFNSLREIKLDPFFERLARNGAEIYLSKVGFSASEGEMLRMSGAGNNGFFAVGRVALFDGNPAVKAQKFF